MARRLDSNLTKSSTAYRLSGPRKTKDDFGMQMVRTGHWDWLAIYWCGKVRREGKRWIAKRSEQNRHLYVGMTP